MLLCCLLNKGLLGVGKRIVGLLAYMSQQVESDWLVDEATKEGGKWVFADIQNPFFSRRVDRLAN